MNSLQPGLLFNLDYKGNKSTKKLFSKQDNNIGSSAFTRAWNRHQA